MLVQTKERVVNEIEQYVNSYWDTLIEPVKYQFIAQRWNRIASKLDLNLRNLVESNENLYMHVTRRGGYVVFPLKIVEEYQRDGSWLNILKSLNLPMT